MTHPYSALPPHAFWRSGVAGVDPATLVGLFIPKFALDREARIATAGSCFAQHVGRALREAGMNVLDGEPPPPLCPAPVARAHGYGIYSARYGNIYTVRQLVELLQDAKADRVDPAYVWSRGARFHDAFRPTIEPEGFASAEEVLILRRAHLAALRALFQQCSHFIFTLGLTEAWAERDGGRVFPTCPGVAAGHFDPERHEFVNFRCSEVLADLERARALLQDFRPGMRMILTVSPVPLTATASGGHVLTATMRSKAVLRAAADEFAASHADVDYFPSYEIVTNPAARGAYFRSNLREVTAEGVDAAMRGFLVAHGLEASSVANVSAEPLPETGEPADEVHCDEILLEALRR